MSNFLFCLNAWNHMPKQQRVALLAQVKHPIVLSNRTFAYLPKWVRQDLSRILLIKKAA